MQNIKKILGKWTEISFSMNTVSNNYIPYIDKTIKVDVPVKRAGTLNCFNFEKLWNGVHPSNAMQWCYRSKIDLWRPSI